MPPPVGSRRSRIWPRSARASLTSSFSTTSSSTCGIRSVTSAVSAIGSRQPDGCSVEVPNVEDALLSVYAVPSFGPFYWQKAHYQNFSQKIVLAAVLDEAGYTAELIPVQRYDLSNHMVWMRDGRPGGFGRYRDLLTPAVERAYADALKARWVCDTVYAVARRR